MAVKTERAAPELSKQTGRRRGWKSIRKNWELYLFVLPTMAYFIIFHYFPMYGVQIAFRDYTPSLGIWGSPWVGLEHLKRFFDSYYFWTLIKNTLGISLYELVVGFPVPILLALALNELRDGAFKKWVQTVTYAPHFISVVVMAGMIIAFTSPGSGLINLAIKAFGGEPVPFLTEPGWFKSVFVLSGVWQSMGWGTIIYLAALAGVDPQQHEAAMIDGATRFQRVWHINLPSIVPTMVILLILNVGSFMSVGFEKVFLLQNPLNLESSDVISTYVYRSGLVQGQFSFSAAIGLFNSVINFILLLTVNRIAKRLNETSLW
ncbi:ABC transporter permease [Paenibacillus ginsengarvi]|uniref:Sugar ABC transporter permease n=1 Tax=Paenibacillus ginsengarvi TaxID=400777 RepID=A0A3B0CLE4_9BACL|nr:sugar ABC transporter permease [Paenibacillus ginsengarvi]RKN85177.1 sugar ABC transporter permease [Paenibacillus ginsengarvi]